MGPIALVRAQNGTVIVELLHIADCPNTELAAERLRAALDASGRSDTPIAQTELTTAPVTTSAAFAGSPNILFDGRDAFPSDGQTSELACRVYATPRGLAGAPTFDQLMTVIAEYSGRAR